MGGSGALGATVAIGLGLLATAVLFDARALYVPGIALVAVALGAVAWALAGLAGASVQRELATRETVEGEPVRLAVSARLALVALPDTTLVDPLLGAPVRVPAGARDVRLPATASFPRRGRHVLAPPALELQDPLRLLRARLRPRTGDDAVLVLPRVEPVVLADGAGEGALVGRARASAGAAETELDGVGALRPGTPASRIHWPALARGAGLLERRLVPEADTRPLVVLDPRGAAPDGGDLDAAARAVASLAVHLARRGGCAVLLPGDRRATPLGATLRGWEALHRRLALVEPDGRPAPGALTGRGAVLLWVAAGRGERVPRALLAAGAGSRTLVVPGGLAGRRASFEVAGCAGYALGAREAGQAA